jgi:transcription initiation factor TFIID subunit 8
MQQFLGIVRANMISNRRTQPIPQDFTIALAEAGILPHELMVHVKLGLPPQVTQPPIAPAEHDNPPPKCLDDLLGGELAEDASRKKWMPAHLPALPSKHTYQHTPIFTQRENNARKIRERATEEGVLAEQAMRKLLINGGHGHAKVPFATKKAEQVWTDTLAAMTEMDNEQRAKEDEGDFEDFGQQDEYDNAMLVNYESRYWREGARGP